MSDEVSATRDVPGETRLRARGHRVDGARCELLLVRHRGGAWWTVYGLTKGQDAGADGVRLSGAEMTALCEQVLGGAQ